MPSPNPNPNHDSNPNPNPKRASCGDFAVHVDGRDGLCLHCSNNPGERLIAGKPALLREYLLHEQHKKSKLDELQLGYARTTLSLERRFTLTLTLT